MSDTTVGVRPESLERIRQTSIGVITDALVRLGIPGDMVGILPLRGFEDRHAVGLARTIRFLPARGTGKGEGSVYDSMFAAHRGEIYVLDAGNSELTVIGDNIVKVAKLHGVEAILINGRARDVDGIRDVDLPVWARGTGTRLHSGYMELVDRDVPVECGGVQVRPGDVIVAAEDGALCIPAEVADTIAENIPELLAIEEEVDQAIRGGAPLAHVSAILGRKKARKPL